MAIMVTSGFVSSAFASIPAKVNTSSAKAYKSASTHSASVSVSKNLKVSITDIDGSWAKVSSNGVTAYMPVKYLTPTQKTKAYTKDSTTVYTTSGKKMCTVSKGAGVSVLGTIDGYYYVMNDSGAIGRVKTGTLTDSKPAVTEVKKTTATTTVSASSKVDAAILVAKSLIGRKYAVSDNPPYSFDCSSFVQYCMGKAGYSMRRSAASQASDNRHALITSTSSLKKGDVLCFDTSGNGKVDHSAIYLGSGKFIEASQKAGKVQINDLSSWYKSHFVCARRPG